MKPNEHYHKETKIVNNPNVKIILLKSYTQQRNLYDQYQQIQDEPNPHPKPHKANLSSIAYLSSILQDEHEQNERKSVAFQQDQVTSLASINHYQKYRSSTIKKSNRYLSCLLEAPQTNERVQHSKTEEIQKKLEKRKIKPIDQLKQKRKNITFSLKNKLDLNKDFNQFVNSQTSNVQHLKLPQKPQDKQTIIFSKRKYNDKSFINMRSDARKQKRQRIMQDVRASEDKKQQGSSLTNKKIDMDMQKPGYAMAFKRLSSDIPRLARFQWSRLDDNSYQLIKN